MVFVWDVDASSDCIGNLHHLGVAHPLLQLVMVMVDGCMHMPEALYPGLAYSHPVTPHKDASDNFVGTGAENPGRRRIIDEFEQAGLTDGERLCIDLKYIVDVKLASR